MDRTLGYPLTRRQRDSDNGIEYSVWLSTDQGACEVTLPGNEAVFFVRQVDLPRIKSLLSDLGSWRSASLNLLSFDHQPVAALYFSRLGSYFDAVRTLEEASVDLMEEDIRPVDRYLMERGIRTGAYLYSNGTGLELRPCEHQPGFRILSLDIETTLTQPRILSVALQQGKRELVLVVGDAPQAAWIESCLTERDLLIRLQQIIKDWDPDILIGWAVISFDLRLIQSRAKVLGVPLALGRSSEPMRVEQGANGRWFARVDGRVVLDGIETLKGATWQFDSFSLESVAQSLLGRGKRIDHPEDRGEEIQRLYREDRLAFAQYNLEDCRLVSEIFETADLIPYLIERSRLTGLPLDKVGGSQQAFDNLYLPRLHRAGYVAPPYASGQDGLEVPGGFVMEPQPGLYKNVLVFDFKSLYPSIMRTFSIDPLGLITAEKVSADHRAPGFYGAEFNTQLAILPAILEQLWDARERAKQEGNSALSQAIKIQMNACYGVLGSRVCRFFDQRLSASITLRGHELLNQTAEHIEETFGYRVIYGDTDSVFVWIGDQASEADLSGLGADLAKNLNRWLSQQILERFGLESHLELQFEAQYERFLMPRMRHSNKGSKKRYAGLKRSVKESILVFKGLESVRSDWTAEAKELQNALYDRVFRDRPWIEFLKSEVESVYRGDRDEKLLYKRRLSRPLEAYQSSAPHVRAARMLQGVLRARGQVDELSKGDRIEYWMTVNGPEPRMCRRSPIDYTHYMEKQLKPVADSILPFLGTSFDQICAPQEDLFAADQDESNGRSNGKSDGR